MVIRPQGMMSAKCKVYKYNANTASAANE